MENKSIENTIQDKKKKILKKTKRIKQYKLFKNTTY